MKVYITTLGRVNRQVTLRAFAGTGVEPTLIVQSHEYDLHRKAHPDVAVEKLPSGIDNLGATRRYLLGRCKRSKCVLLDDDLSFFYRPDPSDWHLLPAGPEQVRAMMDDVEALLGEYAHVGVGGREGHNRVAERHVHNTRYMRVLGYNTALFPEGIQVGRVDGMSDFDLNLQLLRAGRQSCVSYDYAHDQPGTQTPGGCSLTRTQETHSDEIDKMLAWHAPFVRDRVKVNKGGGEFGIRRELTIYWKKAYESSRTKTPGG